MSTTIFWLGDSTCKENKFDTYPQTGIPQAMSRFLNIGIRLVNLAENGRSTRSFLNEGRLTPMLEQAAPGDFVFIQFGHNDEKEKDPARYTAPYGDFQKNLLYMAEEARSRGATPVLITPVARRKFVDGQYVGGSHGAYPAAVLDLAKREGIHAIDLTAASETLLAKLGEAATEKLYMNLAPGESPLPRFAAGQTDNSHFTAAGAFAMAGLLADAMRTLPQLAPLFWQPEHTAIEQNG